MTDQALDPYVRALSTGSGRSPVYRWMRARHDRIAAALRLVGSRPNWDGLADMAMADGVRDARNGRPSAATMRNTWRRVSGELAAPARRVAPQHITAASHGHDPFRAALDATKAPIGKVL